MKQFPFPTAFSKDFYYRHVKTRNCLAKGTGQKSFLQYLSSATALDLVKSKTEKFDKELTHYHSTNFRLFQTERICRQQLQI